MRLGLTVGYSGAKLKADISLVQEAERLGFDSVWTAEAYGSDAITPLAFLAALTKRIKLGTAIMQMPARTPAMTAMTAMSLDHLSGGRFMLGLGPSGPQVIEGWHGVPYGKPLARTREYISIIRKIFAREHPLIHKGEHYEIPYNGSASSGLAKPLKSILHGRSDLPILTASISPEGVACSAEVADGLIPIWMSPESMDLYNPYLETGFSRRISDTTRSDFRLAPFVSCNLGNDLEKCRRPVKQMLALYIGGMGARGKNFYNDYAVRMGYEAEALEIQNFYLEGRKLEAADKVPDRLVDAVALVGPEGRIAERVQVWKESQVTDLLVATNQPDALRVVARAAL